MEDGVTVFGEDYANIYDALYLNKDYGADVRALVKELSACDIQAPARILDLGCGTGRHMELLLDFGYEVVGVDISHSMLDQARNRLGLKAILMTPEKLSQSNIQFDAAYSLFDVLSYQPNLEDVDRFFHLLTAHVRSHGFITADCWHLAGVMSSPPEPRSKMVQASDGREIIRSVSPSVNWTESTVNLQIELTANSNDPSLPEPSTAVERHVMRAFTKLEIQLIAERHGLIDVEIHTNIQKTRELGAKDWHAVFTARKG